MRSRIAPAFFAHASLALALVSVISGRAEAQGPTAPSALQATVSGYQVTLSWGAAAPVTSYVVEAGSAQGLANLAQLEIGATATSVTVNAPGGVYFVRVRARNGTVIGPSSNEVVVTVSGACNIPSPPAALSQSVSGAAVLLAWASVAGATSYIIEAGSGPGLSNLANVGTGTAAATFSATAPPGIYYVRVRALNACGAGPASNEVAVTVGLPTDTSWLSAVNTWRARAGVAPVAEEPAWSQGAVFHSRYVVKEEVSGAENPLSPWFTPEGEQARSDSQGFTSFDVNQVDAVAVEAWILNPFYAVRLLDPALARVGFGSYREAGGRIAMAAYIDVSRGRDNPGTTSVPVLFPAPGSTIPATSVAFNNNSTLGCPRGTACNLLEGWGGNSFTCGGLGGQYNGFPIILQFAPGTTPRVTAASLEGGGISTRVCAFTGDTYTAFAEPYHTLGRRYLRERGAVVLLATRALPAGQTYNVSATVNGQVYQWSFRVQ